MRNSWGRENPYVKLAPGEQALSLAGWVTREAGEKLLALAGKNVDELLEAAESRDFQPIALGIRIRGTSRRRCATSRRATWRRMVPGSDPKLKDEVVIYSAHWDHLGIGTPVNGDSIYNGAIDNATGCAILMELARAWAALPQKPQRSALFLSVTAEEGGLRGSEYYAGASADSRRQDGDGPELRRAVSVGPRQDVVITGAERTTVWPLAQQIAKRMDLTISPDAQPEAGPLLPLGPFFVRARGHPGIFHRARDGIRRQAGGLRREGIGRSTTRSTTTSRPTNSRPIGISRRCSRRHDQEGIQPSTMWRGMARRII